jgi:type IV secretion system protein VirB2
MPAKNKKGNPQANALLLAAIVSALAIEPALAQELAPLENVVDFLVSFLTGAFARSVAIIAVAVMGYLGLTGRLRWGVAGSIIVGIALIFGAASIVDAISGSV